MKLCSLAVATLNLKLSSFKVLNNPLYQTKGVVQFLLALSSFLYAFIAIPLDHKYKTRRKAELGHHYGGVSLTSFLAAVNILTVCICKMRWRVKLLGDVWHETA